MSQAAIPARGRIVIIHRPAPIKAADTAAVTTAVASEPTGGVIEVVAADFVAFGDAVDAFTVALQIGSGTYKEDSFYLSHR